MTGGKVWHYPYFVGLFHTSTPLRSVELSKKWRNSGFHGQGWTCPVYIQEAQGLLDLPHQRLHAIMNKIGSPLPVFPNPLLALKQAYLVVVVASNSLRIDLTALTSFTRPDLSDSFSSNNELTAFKVYSFVILLSYEISQYVQTRRDW